MLGNKTDALNLSSSKSSCIGSFLIKTPKTFVGLGVLLFLLPGCVMTRAQGDQLTYQVRELEDEVAKLQRVRHDMEVLLVGQVRDLIDRIAKMENQLVALRDNFAEGSSKNSELVSELQSLRNELEVSEHRYRNLEEDQKSLAKNQTLAKASRVAIPPNKEDHFASAKKFYLGGKYEESIFLLEQFLKDYPKESDLCDQSNYLLGEIFSKLANGEKTPEAAEKFNKKAVVSFQKIVETDSPSKLREEALFKMGLALKNMGNKAGAEAAFKELLDKHAKSKRVKDAKAELASLKNRKK